MPDEDPEAGEPDEAHEVAGFGLVAGVDATVAQEPGEEPLDMPPPPIATKATAVLSLAVAWMVRGDELDPALLELGVERVAIVCLVADQEPRERFREAGVMVSTTSFCSCCGPLAILAATGRPKRSEMTMILVARPRRVLPTRGPPFLHLRGSRR